MDFPVEEDYSLVGMLRWTNFTSVVQILVWILTFSTFISSFNSQFYFFSLGNSIGTLLSMAMVNVDIYLKMGFISPTKSWVRHGFHTS